MTAPTIHAEPARRTVGLLPRTIVLAVLALLLGACEPATLPRDLPGPAGCGMRDPRGTSPNMLSMAQKMAYNDNSAISEVRPNAKGGLNWIYRMTAGSVFGQQEKVVTLTFDKGGILLDTHTEMVSRLGK